MNDEEFLETSNSLSNKLSKMGIQADRRGVKQTLEGSELCCREYPRQHLSHGFSNGGGNACSDFKKTLSVD